MPDPAANTVAYALFSLMTSDPKEYLSVNGAMIPQKKVLESLYNNPPPDLITAIGHCCTTLLTSIYAHHPKGDAPHIPVTIIGLALAVHNCMAIHPKMDQSIIDQSVSFTQALIQSIPRAKDVYTSLCYHAIIRIGERQINHFDPLQKELFIKCVNLNPLSQLLLIHHAIPPPVQSLACELIPEFEKNHNDCPAQKQDNQWIAQVETLLDDIWIRRWMLHQWINCPQSLESSRNIGLILETLRRHGDYQDFILDFYESCMYYQGINKSSFDLFDALSTCKTYLSTPGASKASRHFNLKGHEYFVLFMPLMELTIENNQIPSRSRHLANEVAALVMASKELYRYMPESGGHAIEFSPPVFEQAVSHG
jgi:hypothetical protein